MVELDQLSHKDSIDSLKVDPKLAYNQILSVVFLVYTAEKDHETASSCS